MSEQPLSPTNAHSASLVSSLEVMANRLRRHSIVSTAEAGSGHPSTCLSCAELVSALFFYALRFDVQNPKDVFNDRFVLSKGHGVPVVWAAWAEAGAFPVSELLNLRKIDSPLEGHPTPRSAWADVATGSLGQGLSIALGMAISARMDGQDSRVYVLTGDGELAEGSVWEAAMLASHRGVDNLIAILDINRFGQSERTMYGDDVGLYEERFRSFGWATEIVDGHDLSAILAALDRARANRGTPYAIVADTRKGKGVSFMEDRDGWHGKSVPQGEMLERALAEIGNDLALAEPLTVRTPDRERAEVLTAATMPPPDFPPDTHLATRQAYGSALVELGRVHPQVVALDGDTKNSTYSQEFLKEFPERFVECFIAEQNMVGTAVGLGAVGKIPFASTFACFLTRAYDQIRMGAVSQANFKLCGSHCGVSIGPDGPSQMGLEDIAMMRTVHGSSVLYPSDAVSTHRLVGIAAETPGIVYIRTSRPKTGLVYNNDTEFHLGGSHVLRSSEADRATLVGAGVTLHEALQACEILADQGILVRVIDLYSVKPIDEKTLQQAARETGLVVTVEDHYPEGGLGDAVLSAIANTPCRYHKIAVTGLPRSGPGRELMQMYGLTADSIADTVESLL